MSYSNELNNTKSTSDSTLFLTDDEKSVLGDSTLWEAVEAASQENERRPRRQL